MEIDGIVEGVWPQAGAVVEPLGGGITNHNFKVVVRDEAFVLRIGGKDTELLGIERKIEHAASRAAAELGVGPEVVRFLEPEGYLVTRFVHGREIPPEEMRVDARIEQAAELLRLFHDADPIPGRFDSFRVVETYRETAERHGVSIPDEYGWAKERADRIEEARGGGEVVPCHNDLLNANFILEGERLWLVDWEYAGMGDRFFDLANFSGTTSSAATRTRRSSTRTSATCGPRTGAPSASCASCRTSVRRCGVSSSRASPSATSTSARTRRSISSAYA